eukprot:TRINITY_DN2636_c0_g1_i10.p1 TRINITY_DN2636_c0_g1~~TRINITY_DN2636_c0_g1_i10.p1  ORF type:complete len:447 (-),score=133.47 TRINITY_DN2636_c0_g1_i10:149-1411(-)
MIEWTIQFWPRKMKEVGRKFRSSFPFCRKLNWSDWLNGLSDPPKKPKATQMSTTEVKNKACLICIDGWGISDETEGNAVHAADTPVMDKLREEYPYTTLSAHGLDVGLPDGLMGNSEVGHLNIGAGRIVYQDIVRIELAVQNETLGELPALQNAFEHAKNESGGRIHFLGLVSDGGVHAHIDHLKALLRTAKAANVPTAFVHFFADGRDTAPTSASGYLADIMKYMQDDIEYGCIADIVGRYYAMDRDTRWERIQVAWEGMTQMNGEETDDPVAVVERRYTEEQTDEFLKPIIVNKEGQIQDNDTLVFIDFRSDRMREITATFGIPEMFNMEIGEDVHVPQNLHIATMTQYKASFPFEVLFAPNKVDNCLSEWISSNGLQQFHTAETEKYAHVTFFFNGGQEAQFKDEEREMVSSPKVAT